jgi:hypothetical protein
MIHNRTNTVNTFLWKMFWDERQPAYLLQEAPDGSASANPSDRAPVFAEAL